MEKGEKGRQRREEDRGVENKMGEKEKRRGKRKIRNEKDFQGREEREREKKMKFSSWDRIP